MAREPVAVDFVGLGERGHEERGAYAVATRLVKPVASVPPEYHRLAHMTAAMAVQQHGSNFRNWAENNTTTTTAASPFARPSGGGGGGGGGGGAAAAAGLSRPPWVNKHAMAMRQLQGQSSSGLTTGEVSDRMRSSVGRDRRWESSAPSSPSHHTMSSSNGFEAFAQQLAQQARKAASMMADPQQALRQGNVATRVPGEEARASDAGAEPSVGHTSSSTQTAAFGSPIPFYSRMKPGSAGPENGRRPEEVNMAPAHAFERLPVSGKQPQSAQLTIFYAGTVNVYDEVPLDKAQAIMLLAGQGSSVSSYVDCQLQAHVAQVIASQPPSRAESPAPQATTTSVGPPSGSTISNRPAPTTTGVELPQARKASLARFLERRKDRVRKGPYTNRNQEMPAAQEARTRLNCDNNSPSPSSSSMPPIRQSLSPNENNRAIGGGASTSGEPHSLKLPSPPTRQRSMSQERPIEPAPSPSPPSRGKAVAKETEEHPS